MAACGFLGIFLTRKGSLSKVSRDSTNELQNLYIHILFQCRIVYNFKPIRASVLNCFVSLQWTLYKTALHAHSALNYFQLTRFASSTFGATWLLFAGFFRIDKDFCLEGVKNIINGHIRTIQQTLFLKICPSYLAAESRKNSHSRISEKNLKKENSELPEIKISSSHLKQKLNLRPTSTKLKIAL